MQGIKLIRNDHNRLVEHTKTADYAKSMILSAQILCRLKAIFKH